MKISLVSRWKNRSAFSLIEMLVVVTIIVIMLAFTTPALMGTLQASKLSSAGESMVGALSEAQQMAFTQNVPVEVRFFSLPDEMNPSNATTQYRAYQLFKILIVSSATSSGTISESLVSMGNLIKIPDGIALVKDDDLSPALSGDGFDDKRAGSNVGYTGVATAKYNALRFMPDGSCRKVGTTTSGLTALTYQTLPQSYMTITTDNGAAITVSKLPKNFFTIQIDPFTGKSRTYRPGF